MMARLKTSICLNLNFSSHEEVVIDRVIASEQPSFVVDKVIDYAAGFFFDQRQNSTVYSQSLYQ